MFWRLADQVKVAGEVQLIYNKNRHVRWDVPDNRAPDSLVAVALDPHLCLKGGLFFFSVIRKNIVIFTADGKFTIFL